METLAEKWSRAKARNTTLIEKDLRGLESQGNWEGTEDVRDAIANYRDIVRGDFEDSEEHSEARSEAWNEVIDTLDTLVEIEE